ncbi:hypothetical protein SAMN05661080_03597 [Modestobacter sp. DSM 44400]|uniref:hypothetical protein n=1 Tax=Modestobacter sp. DSM 44400 TaxID=1550230 RepID=UPI0008979575|nr:hypothetical protein [Modestobacter sp. DSM 44400]SDY47797.1 hypothetical protein SAMN05661080_03597 [Modestobacter sp. DSM 44400]
MGEVLPMLLGGAVGLLFGALRARWRWLVCGLAAVIAGVTATVASGEFRLSWAFLLVDIPLVVASALVVQLVVIRGRQRWFPALADPGLRPGPAPRPDAG